MSSVMPMPLNRAEGTQSPSVGRSKGKRIVSSDMRNWPPVLSAARTKNVPQQQVKRTSCKRLVQLRQDVGAIEVDGSGGVVLRESAERGTAPASRTDCTALMWVAGSMPTVQLSQHFFGGIGLRGTLYFNGIGLIHSALAVKPPERCCSCRSARSLRRPRRVQRVCRV